MKKTIQSITKQIEDLEYVILYSRNNDNVKEFEEIKHRLERMLKIMKINNIDILAS